MSSLMETFLLKIFTNWATSILSAFRRRPKFKVTLLPGPTFCCTFPIGKRYGDFGTHRTAIALYLHIANLGSASSSIDRISIGYHWHLKPFSMLWLRYRVGWFWLMNQSVILTDFRREIGGYIVIYPFLMQQSSFSAARQETFLEHGRSTNGVIYFEQEDSWGGN
jgi:hypothetical protein